MVTTTGRRRSGEAMGRTRRDAKEAKGVRDTENERKSFNCGGRKTKDKRSFLRGPHKPQAIRRRKEVLGRNGTSPNDGIINQAKHAW